MNFKRFAKNIYLRNYINYVRYNIRFLDGANAEIQRKVQEKEWVRMAKYAIRNVPFYRDYFNGGLTEQDITGLKSLKYFPYINKETVRNNLDLFISDKYKKEKLIVQKTAGSSGSPLVLYESSNIKAIERAFHLENWRRVNFAHGKYRMLSIRGREKKAANEDIIKYEPSVLRYSISTFDLFENLDCALNLLTEKDIEFVFTFPTSAEFLAAAALEKGCSPESFPNLKAFLLSSETVYPGMRETIAKAFNARVFSHFGHTEKLILGGECEYSSDYHLFPTYGITELIDDKDQNVTQEGIQGELVGTTLINYAMPLIRYRTGDYAEWSAGECECGRGHKRIKNVYGKFGMLAIYDVNYDKYNLFHAIRSAIYIIKEHPYENFLKYQFIQNVPGELIFNYIPRKTTTKLDEENVSKVFKECFGGKFDLKIHAVKDIILDESGKQKLLIQNIKQAI